MFNQNLIKMKNDQLMSRFKQFETTDELNSKVFAGKEKTYLTAREVEICENGCPTTIIVFVNTDSKPNSIGPQDTLVDK